MKKHREVWLNEAGPLKNMGENIRMARISRGFSVSLLSEQAGVSRKLLYQIEKGLPSVSVGAILSVLVELGLEKDLNKIAFLEKNQKTVMKGQPNRFFRSTMKRRKKSGEIGI